MAQASGLWFWASRPKLSVAGGFTFRAQQPDIDIHSKFGGTPNFTRETRVLPPLQSGYESSIYAIRKWRKLAFAFQLELRVRS